MPFLSIGFRFTGKVHMSLRTGHQSSVMRSLIPWKSFDIPALNTVLPALPDWPDNYYIHDIALLDAARGSGAASKIVQTLFYHAMAARLSNDVARGSQWVIGLLGEARI